MKEIYFGKNLNYLLKKNKKQQADLADLTHKTRPSVNSWIHKNIVPSIDTLILLSNYFSITIEELIFIDLSNDVNSHEAIEYIIKKFLGSITIQKNFNTQTSDEDIKDFYTLLKILYKKEN